MKKEKYNPHKKRKRVRLDLTKIVEVEPLHFCYTDSVCIVIDEKLGFVGISFIEENRAHRISLAGIPKRKIKSFGAKINIG